MDPEQKEKPKVVLRVPRWLAPGRFLATVGRGAARAGVVLLKIFKWPVLIAIPVAVFLLAAWWSLISLLSTDVQTAPDLRGRTPQEARFLLSSRGLRMVTDDLSSFSQEVGRGLVLEQDPAAGARLKRGRSVRVILSAGFRRVLVPNLLGKSLREAELVAGQRGFRLRQRYSVFSSGVPEGHVIAQDPQPTSCFVTEFIEVLASRGPRPRRVVMPELVGRPLLPVLEALRRQGLRVQALPRGSREDVSTRDRSVLRSYVIYRQSPQPGEVIELPGAELVLLRIERER